MSAFFARPLGTANARGDAMASGSRSGRTRSVLTAALGLALAAGAVRAPAATLYGVPSAGNFLVRFDSEAPSVMTAAAIITGLQAGERIVGIAFRPRTGQLYGIGITPGATDTVRVYWLDPLTGAATLLPGSTSFTVTAGAVYGVAFNPTVDRIRVVNSSDENFRVNPNNGVRADAPTNDTDLNPAGNLIVASAYDRPFDSGLAVANRTTLYAISVVSDSLVTQGGINQSPSPNGGSIMNSLPLGFAVSATDAGFDIDLDGTGWAALNVAARNRLYSIDLGTGTAAEVGLIGDGNLLIGGLAVLPPSVVAVGADAGSEPRVRVFDPFTNAQLFDFLAFDANLKRGVRVALGDVNFDSVPDIITAPGKGSGAEIRVFDGATGLPVAGPLASLLAFDAGFKGGVFVAAGDVNADGQKDVIVGAGAGPQVKVFSAADGSELASFDAYDPAFKGGVQVAAADFDRDGDWEIVTGAGKGGDPELRIFDATGNPFTSASLPSLPNAFLAYDATFRKGIFVAAGDVNGDGVPDLVTGPGKGGAPEVAVFSGVDGAELARFLAFDAKQKSGVRVALADVDGDGRLEILASPGKAKAPLEIRAFDALTLEDESEFLAFDPSFRKGAFVAGVRR